jgi:hypothetical protein
MLVFSKTILCGLPRFSVSRFILSSKSPNENSHIIQEIFDCPLAKDQAGGKKELGLLAQRTCARLGEKLQMRVRMLGFRQCAACGKTLPEECYRNDSPQCRTCQREEEQRNPVVRIAPGIIAVLV